MIAEIEVHPVSAPADLAAIETAELSDIGRQRVSNQDACASAVSIVGARLLIVADGMGGHAGGATASRMAVQTVMEHVELSSQAPEVLLRSALEEANRRVYAESLRDSALTGARPGRVLKGPARPEAVG